MLCAQIYGALRVKTAIEDETLQPDCIGRRGQLPLCMFQYKRIFGTTRIPKETQDELVVYEGQRHVTIVVDGVFYSFDAVQQDGSILPVVDIHQQLLRIWKMANRDKYVVDCGCVRTFHTVRRVFWRWMVSGCVRLCRDTLRDPGMARMTYDGRDEWAAAREHMLTNPVNARSLRTIER